MLPTPKTVLGVGLLALAALGHPAGQDDERAAELATLARDLAARGEAAQAAALVRGELAPDLPPSARATLTFTLAWLEHRLADQDQGRRVAHLENARERYLAGLELRPEARAARANLALVEGDLALERGEREAALAAWRRALSIQPDLPGAGERFLALLGSDADALAAEAETLERSGHLALARAAWARALAATPPEGQGEPALRWLLLAAESGELSRADVDELRGTGGPIAELRLLVGDPLRAPRPSWAASPLGGHAVAAAFRGLARERRRVGAATEALELVERGLAVAPDVPIARRPPVAAGLAVERLELLLAEPGLDPGGARTEAAVDALLAVPAGELEREPDLARRAEEALGRALLARGDRADAGPGTARFHLERALALAGPPGPDGASPAPAVSSLLGGVYVRAGEVERALDAHLDAALGHLEGGERDRAAEALREAEALDLALGGEPRVDVVRTRLGQAPPAPPPPTPDELAGDAGAPAAAAPGRADGLVLRLFDWDRFGRPSTAGAFRPSAWYVGGSVGAAFLGASEGDVEDDLAGFGSVGVDLDDSTTALRAYAGYRFAQPFAVELGYADHGTIDSTVGPEPAMGVDDFLDEIADEHPANGSGPTLALRTLLLGNDRLGLGAKVGVWRWEADVDVRTTTNTVTIDRDGVDPFWGVDLAWHPVEWGALRLDYERFAIDDEDTDVLSFGIELQLDRLVR